MLTRIILFPCIFASTLDEQVIILLLRDILKSGIILTDNQGEVLRSIRAKIDRWNPKFKPKAKAILEELEKRHRFVEILPDQQLFQVCSNQVEKKCLKIFTSKEFYKVLVRNSQCINNTLAINRVTFIGYYAISSLVDKLEKSDLTLNKYNEDQFKQEILIPLFRDAKHIKMYDRWIGRSASQGTTNHQTTLKWLLEVFREVATIRSDTVVEAYCGIRPRRDDKIPLPKAVAALRKFEAEIQVLFPYLNFKLFIKKEIKDNELPHDRYIITNQTAIYIGRGFDLFVDANESYPRRIRDVQIGYCSNPAEVQNHYKDRRLRDL